MSSLESDCLNYWLSVNDYNYIQQLYPSYPPVYTPPYYYYQNFMMPSPDLAMTDISTPEAMAAYAEAVAEKMFPKKNVICKVCDLSFTSECVYDTHVEGSKHRKKLKSIELMKSLEPLQREFVRDDLSGVIKCNVCDITVNSPQLLVAHMAGGRHKSNAGKSRKAERERRMASGPLLERRPGPFGSPFSRPTTRYPGGHHGSEVGSGRNHDNPQYGRNHDNEQFGRNHDNEQFGRNHDNQQFGHNQDDAALGRRQHKLQHPGGVYEYDPMNPPTVTTVMEEDEERPKGTLAALGFLSKKPAPTYVRGPPKPPPQRLQFQQDPQFRQGQQYRQDQQFRQDQQIRQDQQYRQDQQIRQDQQYRQDQQDQQIRQNQQYRQQPLESQRQGQHNRPRAYQQQQYQEDADVDDEFDWEEDQCLPSCVETTDEYYICKLCDAKCNSWENLSQHLASKKHAKKLIEQRRVKRSSVTPTATTAATTEEEVKRGVFGRLESLLLGDDAADEGAVGAEKAEANGTEVDNAIDKQVEEVPFSTNGGKETVPKDGHDEMDMSVEEDVAEVNDKQEADSNQNVRNCPNSANGEGDQNGSAQINRVGNLKQVKSPRGKYTNRIPSYGANQQTMYGGQASGFSGQGSGFSSYGANNLTTHGNQGSLGGQSNTHDNGSSTYGYQSSGYGDKGSSYDSPGQAFGNKAPSYNNQGYNYDNQATSYNNQSSFGNQTSYGNGTSTYGQSNYEDQTTPAVIQSRTFDNSTYPSANWHTQQQQQHAAYAEWQRENRNLPNTSTSLNNNYNSGANTSNYADLSNVMSSGVSSDYGYGFDSAVGGSSHANVAWTANPPPPPPPAQNAYSYF